MLEDTWGSRRLYAGLHSHTLCCPRAFVAAWATVSVGHGGSVCAPCVDVVGIAFGFMRIHHRRVSAIAFALVAAEEDRRADHGAACRDGAVGES